VQVATINSDISGIAVPAAVSAGAPDLGAYQFVPTASVPALTLDAGQTLGTGINDFYFLNRKVATIDWTNNTGTAPTSLTGFYYPGTDLSTSSNGFEYFSSYWQFDASGDSNITYDITLYFNNTEKGNITSTVQLAKTINGGESWWNVPVSQSSTSNSITAFGLTSFSRFTGTGSLTPLPVNLDGFTAIRKSETTVALNWKTRGEINNEKFEIERSFDGINFIRVGTVNGNGTTNTVMVYQFEDQVLASASPVLYYRLKQVDFNGDFEYSEIKRVANTTSAVDLKAWYNQSEQKIQVSTISNVAEPVTITVVDIQGRVVAQQTTQLTKGNNSIKLDMQGLPNGIYTFMLASAEGVKFNKIVKF
jgi:hypothetical protein